MRNCIKYISASIILFVAFAIAGCKGNGAANEGDANDSTQVVVEEPRHIEYGVDVTDLDVVQGKVANGQIITSLLRNLGANKTAITQAAFIPDSVFDVRRMKAGQRYSAYYTQDSVPQLVYLV